MLEVAGVAKVFASDLRRSLRYAAKDIGREVFAREPRDVGHLRAGEFKALDGVSFALQRGESLGIVGDNGAGKSTLLKILYGLIKPDAGEVRVRGRVAALLELGTGFDPVLTGRENIFVNGAILGLSGKRLRAVAELVIEFAELEDAIDTPVRYYSSGMSARLAFAIAANLEPDVLLIDEVLAVGDIAFQRKCAVHMLRYVDRGGSLIFVSHNAHQVMSLCSRGLVLDGGRQIFTGTAVEALGHYHALRAQTGGVASSVPREPDARWPVPIVGVSVKSTDGGPARTGQPARVEVEYRSDARIDAIWGFSFYTADQWICITGAYDLRPRPLGPGGGTLSCVIPALPLVPGQYTVRAGIGEPRTMQALGVFGYEDAPLVLAVEGGATVQEVGMTGTSHLTTLDVDWEPLASGNR